MYITLPVDQQIRLNVECASRVVLVLPGGCYSKLLIIGSCTGTAFNGTYSKEGSNKVKAEWRRTL